MKNRPVELVSASVACAEAWVKRDEMIEAGDKIGVEIMDLACAILDERYNSLYRQWQLLGGTSDIDSIVLFCDRVIEDSKAITVNGGIDPLARARSIALPNGQLRSYATYKNTGKAQPLKAEDVDGERLGE